MSEIKICAPSRIYEQHPGGRFSYSAMVDYFAKIGIPAIDMSFESLERHDDATPLTLFSAAARAASRGVDIPLCHLSFYMPDPNDRVLMAKYQKELFFGIDAAATMKIPLAVAHPIAYHSSERSYGDWVRANIAFLTPVVKYGREKGVKICIENMPSTRESANNHLYGSCALNISALAGKIGAGICWDTGHAHVSGWKQSEQLEILAGKLDVLHVHDNDGKSDAHLLPFEGGVDWADVAQGIKLCGFDGILDVEVTAWALDGDAAIREQFGREIYARALRLLSMTR